MYGVQVAVILLACAITVLALWTAPIWTRALARFASFLWGGFEHTSRSIEKQLGIQPDASGGSSRTRLLLDRNPDSIDSYPEEEK